LGLGGCTAILDFSDPIGDPVDGGAVDGGPEVDGGADAALAVCLAFEPNENTAEATPIMPMDIAAATCAPDDVDVYAFTVAAGQDVQVTLSFTYDVDHDLDLRLLDADGGVITVSSGTGDTEQITRTLGMANALPEGNYHIEVQPIAVADLVPYSINLSVTPST
jgi:hypothetical protein